MIPVIDDGRVGQSSGDHVAPEPQRGHLCNERPLGGAWTDHVEAGIERGVLMDITTRVIV